MSGFGGQVSVSDAFALAAASGVRAASGIPRDAAFLRLQNLFRRFCKTIIGQNHWGRRQAHPIILMILSSIILPINTIEEIVFVCFCAFCG